MEPGGTRRAKEFVPCFGTESNDARQARFNAPKFNGAHQPCKIGKKGPQDRVVVMPGTDADNQKNRRARERTDHWLWKNDFISRLRCAHLLNLYPANSDTLLKFAAGCV